MIHAFKNLGTQDIFDGKDSKAARKTCTSILSESGYPGFEDLQDFCLNQDVQDFRIYRIFSGTMEIKKL